MKSANQYSTPSCEKADEYHRAILKRILEEGYEDIDPRPRYADGTPAHTRSINHAMCTYDLSKGELPLISLRPIAWKSAIKEIFWIYIQESNKLEDLHKMGVHYWDDWDVGDGTIGARYGETVRRHKLMKHLLKDIEENPFGRRHVLSLWQEDDFQEPGLHPCCFMNIYNVRKTDDSDIFYLDCMMIQRSSDFATSVSINEIQYVALQMMIARHFGYQPGVFTHVLDNVQIYDRHIEQAKELIHRRSVFCSPVMVLNPKKQNIYKMSPEDFTIAGYEQERIRKKNPQLKFELAI